jgi:hypothetical protein
MGGAQSIGTPIQVVERVVTVERSQDVSVHLEAERRLRVQGEITAAEQIRAAEERARNAEATVIAQRSLLEAAGMRDAALHQVDSKGADVRRGADTMLADEIEQRRAALKAGMRSAVEVIPSTDVAIGALIGAGSYGVVHAATWKGTAVAVKAMTFHVGMLTEDMEDAFKCEALAHAKLDHENVVRLHGVCLDPGKYSLVMELMPKGSLFQLLRSNWKLPWPLRISIACDIATGLQHLHDNHVLHCDLKSLNILLDDRLRAKLCDFGMSRIKMASVASTTLPLVSALMDTPGGTLRWLAPELLDVSARHTAKTDIYALGVVLYELSSRKIPFEEQPYNDAVRYLIKENKREEIPSDTPAGFADLIRNCWHPNAAHRPASAAVVLAHMRDIRL